MALQATIGGNLSLKTGGDEIADNMVTELDSVLVVPNKFQIVESSVIELSVANSVSILVESVNTEPEGGNDGDSGVNIEHEGENMPTHEKVIKLIARAIKTVSALTMATAVHAAHSELASGVVFGHNKITYNVTLTVIFALGVAEFVTGLWISVSDSLTYMRRLCIGGIVLFLSICLLVGIHMGGFA